MSPGAINVDTGKYTGRSPKDKYLVMDEVTKDTIWWTTEKNKNDNKAISGEVWQELKATALTQLSGKTLYVVDGFCGERYLLKSALYCRGGLAGPFC